MKTKIKILKNSSIWLTQSLKKILNQTLRVFLRWESYNFPKVKVFIEKRKSNRDVITGAAYLYGPLVYLKLPSHFYPNFQEGLAITFYHELQHTKGLEHNIIGRFIDKDCYPDMSFLNNILIKRKVIYKKEIK